MARVVIVEDEAQVLLLAESVLQQAGHETVSAGTVAEAQAVINGGGPMDLVFTDIQLANHPEGGITIGKLIGEKWPGTPVLYTSGRPATDGMEALFVEPHSFLQKPYTADQLIEAVDALLNSGAKRDRRD
jgi:DNA-binding NtrC family response regulator